MLKEVFSRGLNQNITLDFFEDVDEISGRKITKVTHASLQAVYNKLLKEGKNITFDYQEIPCLCDISNFKVVFKCVLSVDGKQYHSIGETCKSSLGNEISTNFAALMAFYRGFDLCMKQYLDTADTYYSDTEILSKNTPKSEEAPKTQENKASIQIDTSAQIQTKESKKEEAPSIDTSEKVSSKPVENNSEPAEGASGSSDDAVEEAKNFKLPFGKYQGKSIREVLNTDPEYLSYLLGLDYLKDNVRKPLTILGIQPKAKQN